MDALFKRRGAAASSITSDSGRASKHVAACLGIASLLVGLIAEAAPIARAESAPLKDAALISCIKTRLGLASSDTATDEQLATVTSLSCSGKGIADLTGIGRLPNLQKAFLQNNSISDVSPLAANKEIFSLNLSGNQIADISPLRELTKLSSVNLASNQIGDLSPAGHVPKLNVTSNSQTVAGVPAQTGIVTAVPTVIGRTGETVRPEESPAGVTIRGNEVTYPAAGTYTWKFWDESRYYNGSINVEVVDPKPASVDIPDVNLRGCVTKALKIADSDPITPEQAASLKELICYGKKVTSIEGLQHFTGLTKLVLSTNQITELGPLQALTGLTELMIPGNPVGSIEPLRALTGLVNLSLRDTGVTDLTPLKSLTNLSELDVSYAKPRGTQVGKARLTSLEGLGSLTSLTRLVAHDQAISDLSPLAGLTQLQTLAASGNEISDLEPLASTGLTKVVLDRNKIADISPLSKLDLVEISMTQNAISDVSPLSGKKLEKIYLSSNQIADLSPVSTNYVRNGNFDARWQAAVAPTVPAKMAVSAPTVRAADGKDVAELTPPEGITVANGKVTYPQAGEYKWTFSDSKFAGSVTQQVTEPVVAAANIPDTNLRRCIAVAAGKDAGAIPTEADVAGISSLSCADRSVKDLTGLASAGSLTTLDLAGNPLGSLDVLGKMTALKTLNLSRTEMNDTSAIASVRGLDEIILDGNHLRDLSALTNAATTIRAKDQTVRLASITGDEPSPIPAIVDRNGSPIPARTSAAGVTTAGGKASYSLAGDYTWQAASADGLFTATLVQPVTRDRVAPPNEDDAEKCLAAKNVWVVVERDSGLLKGGCATKFATGIEALTSAGFDLTESGGFVQKIDGYPSRQVSWTEGFWAYFHLTPGDGQKWEFSTLGAGVYQPQPGTVEGWRFGPGVEPRWKPVSVPTPAPAPKPTTSATASPTPSATASPTPSAPASPSVSASPSLSVESAKPSASVTPRPRVAPWASGGADIWALTKDGAWFYDASKGSGRHDFEFVKGAMTDVTMLKQYDWFGSSKMDLFERKTNGDLTLRVDGTGTPTVIGGNWGQITDIIPMGGRATGEAPLLVARHRNGELYAYRWANNRLYGTGVVGKRWNSMRAMFSLGSSMGDAHADILAINRTNDTLYGYLGQGKGKISEAVRLSGGWGSFVAFTPGRIDSDALGDLAGLRGDGELFAYRNNGQGVDAAEHFGGGFADIDVRIIG